MDKYLFQLLIVSFYHCVFLSGTSIGTTQQMVSSQLIEYHPRKGVYVVFMFLLKKWNQTVGIKLWHVHNIHVTSHHAACALHLLAVCVKFLVYQKKSPPFHQQEHISIYSIYILYKYHIFMYNSSMVTQSTAKFSRQNVGGTCGPHAAFAASRTLDSTPSGSWGCFPGG